MDFCAAPILNIEHFHEVPSTALSFSRYERIPPLMIVFINKRVLKAFDVDVMAAQLAFPISNWICAIDRNHEIEGETLELIERHIRQFFKVYSS